MELEVRTSPRLRNCFVALPMHLIYALQDGHGSLPALVILEARSTQDKGVWCLAWAGASSNSRYMEISDKYAECLELPSGAIVLVKALADVPTAQTVLVEPASEDDWEILELNAEFLEEQVLSQVGILTAGQHFPVWVRGQNMLTLRVTSSSPQQVVKLAPGTELIVAPKERKQMQEPHELPSKNSAKAFLRVQELDGSLALRYKMGSLSCCILPTTVLFISPETASIINFKEGQLVILQCARVLSKVGKNQQVETTLRESKQNSNSNETQKDTKNQNRNVILRLVYCNLVCRGHAMLSSSLRQLLGARIHSRLLIRVYAGQPNQVQPVFSLSPAYILPNEKQSANPDYLITGNNGEVKDLQKTSEIDSGDLAWKHLKHMDLITSLNDSIRVSQKGSNGDVNKKAQILFKLWLLAQLSFASRCGPLESYSVPLADEVILDFCINSKSRLQKDTESTDRSIVHLDEFSMRVCYLLRLGGSDNISENVDLNRQHLEPLKYKGIFLLKGKIPLDWNSVHEILYDDDFLPLLEVRLLDIPRPILSLLSDLGDVGGPNLESLTWLKDPASETLDRLRVLLCPKAKEEARRLGLPSPGYVLLHGPPACGKTKLALAIAKHLQDDPHILAHRVYVRCSELEGEQGQTVRLVLKEAAFEAIKHAPSLIILDDLDAIISSSSTPESSELSSIAAVLSEFLADLIDSCQVHSNNRIDEPVAFLAIVQATSSLPSYLRCSGRFDLHIALQPPASTERAAILGQELIQRGITCEDDIISRIAAKCDGYDAVDLEILVDRAVHVAAVRFLSSEPVAHYSEASYQQMSLSEGTGLVEVKKKYELYEDDFTKALDGFAPVSMRDISKSSNQGMQLGWGDVGGLTETCQALKEMLELPVKFSKIFAEAPLRLRTGVLLYGPPGCGKTHIVGVAAAACSLRFISVKGPELLNKYIGASEQAVRDVFSKASAAAPCILFFDEFDAIAPKRGHDSTGVTDRVVNQLLTELDGVESLNGVFVFAATSRPDLLDAALLRPGRLDRLLFCDFPSLQDRFEILEVLSRKLNLSTEIDLTEIAALAEGFSGADLQALLSDAQLEAVHVYLDKVKDNEGKARNEENPFITMDILHNITLKARPSVSYEEKRRLHNIYSSFTNGRSSVGVKSRDVKGKRSTLA